MDASPDPIAVVRAAARTEMLERLAQFATAPKAALVLAGTSGGADDTAVAEALRGRFSRARIFTTVDPDAGAAAERPLARTSGAFDALGALRRFLPGIAPPVERLAAPASRLPLADGCVDLVLGDWLAPGSAALDAVLAEARRVLAPGGLFLWITPGLGAAAEPIDMHDLGAALARAGFVEPVLDVDRHRGPDGAPFETVHAAAFAGAVPRGRDGETVIPIDMLGRRGRTGA